MFLLIPKDCYVTSQYRLLLCTNQDSSSSDQNITTTKEDNRKVKTNSIGTFVTNSDSYSACSKNDMSEQINKESKILVRNSIGNCKSDNCRSKVFMSKASGKSNDYYSEEKLRGQYGVSCSTKLLECKSQGIQNMFSNDTFTTLSLNSNLGKAIKVLRSKAFEKFENTKERDRNLMCSQAVEVKMFADKSTFCRPVWNTDYQKLLSKSSYKLRLMAHNVIESQKREAQMQVWKNYINKLENKSKHISTRTSNHSTVRIQSNIDGTDLNLRSMKNKSRPCRHLLHDMYVPRCNNEYNCPSCELIAQYESPLFIENNPLCFTTSKITDKLCHTNYPHGQCRTNTIIVSKKSGKRKKKRSSYEKSDLQQNETEDFDEYLENTLELRLEKERKEYLKEAEACLRKGIKLKKIQEEQLKNTTNKITKLESEVKDFDLEIKKIHGYETDSEEEGYDRLSNASKLRQKNDRLTDDSIQTNLDPLGKLESKLDKLITKVYSLILQIKTNSECIRNDNVTSQCTLATCISGTILDKYIPAELKRSSKTNKKQKNISLKSSSTSDLDNNQPHLSYIFKKEQLKQQPVKSIEENSEEDNNEEKNKKEETNKQKTNKEDTNKEVNQEKVKYEREIPKIDKLGKEKCNEEIVDKEKCKEICKDEKLEKESRRKEMIDRERCKCHKDKLDTKCEEPKHSIDMNLTKKHERDTYKGELVREKKDTEKDLEEVIPEKVRREKVDIDKAQGKRDKPDSIELEDERQEKEEQKRERNGKDDDKYKPSTWRAAYDALFVKIENQYPQAIAFCRESYFRPEYDKLHKNFRYSKRNKAACSISTESISKQPNFDRIVLGEIDRSNRARRDIQNMLVDPLTHLRRDCASTLLTDHQLPKIKPSCDNRKENSCTIEEERRCSINESTSEHSCLKSVTTDNLSFLDKLQTSSETMRRLLSALNLDHNSYLQILHFPQLSRQIATRDQIPQYVCVCGSVCRNTSQLNDHIQEHDLGNVSYCCICQHYLSNEEWKGQSPFRFKCRYCGQRFIRAYCHQLHQQSCADRLEDHDSNYSLSILV